MTTYLFSYPLLVVLLSMYIKLTSVALLTNGLDVGFVMYKPRQRSISKSTFILEHHEKFYINNRFPNFFTCMYRNKRAGMAGVHTSSKY